MGQKIDYNPADWDDDAADSSAEGSLPTTAEGSLPATAEGSFDRLLQDAFDNLDNRLLQDAFDNLDIENADDNSGSPLLSGNVTRVTGDDVFDDIDDSVGLAESLSDKRTAFADSETLAAISPEDKALFNRQLEDLFELLELEQSADKETGVKIYQTDPSPSRPWRFH